TGFGMGGNKARKLEFLLADALAKGADTVVTAGGPQSNHCRMTAAAARKLGLQPVLVFYGDPPSTVQGNLLLDTILEAELIYTGETDRASVDRALEEVCAGLRAKGRTPYPIPRGGAVPLGDVGYVVCALEMEAQLLEQGIQPTHVFCATGSCGTQAGLLAGAIAYRVGYRVCGVTVSRPLEECRQRIQRLAEETLALLGVDVAVPSERVIVYGDYIGPGYGISTPGGREAIRLLAQTEGLFADPVYTGKALAGLIDRIRQGELTKDHTLIFLHTGGTPALFAHAREIQAGESRRTDCYGSWAR
ncbi:MAG: D-cysteine desulfhydrase family protein, partial [Chloroflexi bacterium]|nr:D-cysteine desulfhydrase family protein [Chloroflexota bacterium]